MADPIELVDRAWPGLLAQIQQASADGVPASDLVGICLDGAVTASRVGLAMVERWGATSGSGFAAMLGHVRARELLRDLGLTHVTLGDDRIARPFVICITSPEPDVIDAHYRNIEMPASPTPKRETVH